MKRKFLNVHNKPEDSNFGIIGIETCSSKELKGTVRAFKEIRKLSQRYANGDGSSFPLKIYNPEKNYLLPNVKICDCGSIRCKFKNLEKEIELNDFFSKNYTPIFLGGDHAVTYSITKNISEPFTIIHCDAHGDYLNEFEFDPHGSVMYEVNKNAYLDKIIHLGLRGNLNTGPGLNESLSKGNIILTRSNLKTKNDISSLIKTKKIYISIDTDFFDPSIAMGTNYPEHNGILYEEALNLFQNVIRKKEVIGIDIVEYNPDLDVSNITGLLITNLIMELMHFIYKSS